MHDQLGKKKALSFCTILLSSGKASHLLALSFLMVLGFTAVAEQTEFSEVRNGFHYLNLSGIL